MTRTSIRRTTRWPVVVASVAAFFTASPQGGAAELQLQASDGTRIFATLHPASGASTAKNRRAIVLLFHQAGSNRHEYDPIVPVLNAAGFDTLAIDQRSGGTMWGAPNQTVRARGGSVGYLQALPDLQAALDWARDHAHTGIVALGSSYSAALVFLLAERNRGQLAGVAAFSPGEHLSRPHLVKRAAASLALPIYVTAAATDREQAQIDEVLSSVTRARVVRYRAPAGVHGASTLRQDRNPRGAEANLKQLVGFLATCAGIGPRSAAAPGAPRSE